MTGMRNVLFGEWSLHPSVWGLWILLTTAALGFAVLLGGFYAENPGLKEVGVATLATGAVCFLFVQFWITTTNGQPRAPSRGFDYPTAKRQGPTGAKAPAENFDRLRSHTLERVEANPPGNLVLFEAVPTVDARPDATATQKADQVLLETAGTDSSPTERWPPTPEEPPREAIPDYRAATLERRNTYIKDLPIVEDILKAPTPSPSKSTRTLGKCGGCGTKLWAPATRPIRLRCPRCGRSSTLH